MEKTKKKKGEQPARIIKTVPASYLKELAKSKEANGEPAQKEDKGAPVSKAGPPAPGAGADDARKEKKGDKKKKGPKKPEPKDANGKVSVRWRRKEVYERADLYLDRGINRLSCGMLMSHRQPLANPSGLSKGTGEVSTVWR